MTAYDITLSGCDDCTYLVDVELTEAEHAAVARVAELATAAGGGCSPTMLIAESPAAPPENELCTECWERLDGTPATRRGDQWAHKTCPDGSASATEQ